MRIPVRVVDRVYEEPDLNPDTDMRFGQRSRLRPIYDERGKTSPEHMERDDKVMEDEAMGRQHGYSSTEKKRKKPKPDGGNGDSPGGAMDEVRATDESVDWKDAYVRLKADFENLKKHSESERDKLAGIGKEAVLHDLFPLIESLERAIKAAVDAGEDNGILAGLEIVYKETLGVLEKHGAERIATEGEYFDPKIHEAVAVVDQPGVTENTIVEELRPGFMRHGKLLRPASVVVAQ